MLALVGLSIIGRLQEDLTLALFDAARATAPILKPPLQ